MCLHGSQPQGAPQMAILKFTSGSTHTCYSRLCHSLESGFSPSCLWLWTLAFGCLEGLSVLQLPPKIPPLADCPDAYSHRLLLGFFRGAVALRALTPQMAARAWCSGLPVQGRACPLMHYVHFQAQGQHQPHLIPANVRQNGYGFPPSLSSGEVETSHGPRRQAPWFLGE